MRDKYLVDKQEQELFEQDLRIELACRLSQLRKERRMTCRLFAARMGISPSTVMTWEKGYNFPSVVNLLRAAKILKVDICHLLGLKEREK